MIDNGVDYVVIDNGSVQKQIREIYPEGVNKVLELVGTGTLKDSLKCLTSKGIVCMTGTLGNEWTMKDFTPMGDIPSLGRLTVYMGESKNLSKELLKEFIDELQNVIDKNPSGKIDLEKDGRQYSVTFLSSIPKADKISDYTNL